MPQSLLHDFLTILSDRRRRDRTAWSLPVRVGLNALAVEILDHFGPKEKRDTIDCFVLAIHKAVGYAPAAGKIGGTVNERDMLPIGELLPDAAE